MILLKQDTSHVETPHFEEEIAEIYESPSVASGVDVDPITQLRANLSQVEDLIGRLRYVMGEVNSIIKKKA